MSQLLAGNTALVLGVANRWSLASAILTFQGDRQKQTVEELANDLHAEQAIPCDVSSENQLAALTSRLKGLDTPLHAVVHSIAFANRDDLSRPFLETSRDGFKLAHEISAYSLIAVACATAALMPAKDVGGGGKRRVGVGYRAREPFVPAAVEDVYGACSLGPVIVTSDELTDPYNLAMECTIEREGKVLFTGKASTASLHRKIEKLIEYLLRSNPVPAGSVLLTGTGIIVTEECALHPGDVVTIRVPEIGELVNTAAVVH